MTSERACALDEGWLLVVDYASGKTRLLDPIAAKRWCQTSSTSPVPRVRWAPSWSTHEVPLAWEPPPRVSWRALATAGVGVLVTLTTAKVGTRGRKMHRLLRLVWWVSKLPRRATPATRAEEMVNAVRHFGFLPSRIACLESSVATVVALALQGWTVTWHHGVRCDPIVLHAWISINGVPVAEPPSTARCAKLLTITSETNKERA